VSRRVAGRWKSRRNLHRSRQRGASIERYDETPFVYLPSAARPAPTRRPRPRVADHPWFSSRSDARPNGTRWCTSRSGPDRSG